MDAATRRLVRKRAGDRCEYCGLRQDESPLANLQVDHILPKKHGGDDSVANLALACIDCNLHKGSDIAGIDPDTRGMAPLFNPRTQAWNEHFAQSGALIVGLTPIGRATVAVLDLNEDSRLELRTLRGP